MSDSFKIEDKKGYKQRKNKSISKTNLLIVFGTLTVICGIIGSIIYYFVYYINYIPKEDKDKPYIYTAEKYENIYEDDTYNKVPKINLKGQKFQKLNQAIKKNYDEVSQMLQFSYDYEFNKSKNILALKISYSYFSDEEEQYPVKYFETFNIDLRNGKLLSNSDILKKYGLTEKLVNNFMESRFQEMYSDLVEGEFYTEKECNYECFLENRGITKNYLNGVSYYIDDGSLTLFKFYYVYSDYLEEQYLEDVGYQFLVKE